jgi:hypothetical protein
MCGEENWLFLEDLMAMNYPAISVAEMNSQKELQKDHGFLVGGKISKPDHSCPN